MRAVASASLIAFMAYGAFGQSATEPTAFAVASIKRYPVGSSFPAGAGIGVKSFADGVAMRYIKLWMAVAWAYDVQGQVLGPDWINSERYDIVGKAEGPVREDQLKLMVQTLLADRFKLTFHRETKELRAAVLIVGKNGSKNLPAGKAGDPPDIQRADGKLVFRNIPLSRLVDALTGTKPPYGVNERVLDQTGLMGVFDIILSVNEVRIDNQMTLAEYEELKSATFDSFARELEKHYGLKLEHRKVRLEGLVIDSGNKIPTEN
jgi:uncharacterized protein (TIGR03435 family)